ncbi:MAG: Gfo/Idh/MocA family protein, partial [Flavobacteriales bacterium]
DTPEALVKAVDMVDIVTPTLSHHEMAMLSLKHGKQIFIEKPIANNVDEANEVTDFAKANNLLGQVGHVERFNPAFKAAISSITDPMFIESHRLSEFNPRGTDVPVVLDLMIHDIDIVLSLVKSPIKSVSASGVSVISATPDIANARIEFENGCVANLTASRISLKTMRKTRFFQKDAYISVDFLEKKVEIVKMKDAPKELADFAMILQNAEGKKMQIYFENPKIETSNAILEELESFADAIENQTTPIVSLENGTKALEVANMIIDSYSS